MNKKKIAYVTNHASFFFSHILPIAAKAKKRFDIKLFHGLSGSKKMELYALKKLKEYKIPTSKFKLTTSGLSLYSELIAMISLLRSINIFKPDIIHCATPKGILYGGLVSRILNIKSLVIFNTGMGFLFSNKLNLYEKVIKNLYILILKNIILKHKNKKIIIENNDDINFFKKVYKVNQRDIVFIKGAGVNLKKFRPNYSLSNNLVLMPSRVIKEKGIFEFATAAMNLKGKFPEWHFSIAGAIDYNKKSSFSKKQLAYLNKIKDVKFMGYIKDMRSIYKNSGIVCLPSYREGFSKVFLEAAAMGIPIVTSNVIGCKDSIKPGITGLLCESKSAKSIEKKIQFLIENKNIRSKFSKNARKFALQNFDINKVISKNISIYIGLINNEKKTNFSRT